METQVYHPLGNKRLVHILSKLNNSFSSSMSEHLNFKEQPTIEHIMPREWIQHWPLPNGEEGMSDVELWNADDDDERAIATRLRNSYIHRIGNLTILSGALNSSGSNLDWNKKRSELINYSLLPLNLQLHTLNQWDENAIATRARELFEHAVKIWPH